MFPKLVETFRIVLILKKCEMASPGFGPCGMFDGEILRAFVTRQRFVLVAGRLEFEEIHRGFHELSIVERKLSAQSLGEFIKIKDGTALAIANVDFAHGKDGCEVENMLEGTMPDDREGKCNQLLRIEHDVREIDFDVKLR